MDDAGLKQSIDRQNELQEQANSIMQSLVTALENLAQEIEDLRNENREKATRGGD